MNIHNAWLRDEQLACLQLLAEWRLNQAKARDMAVNFVVKKSTCGSGSLFTGLSG